MDTKRAKSWTISRISLEDLLIDHAISCSNRAQECPDKEVEMNTLIDWTKEFLDKVEDEQKENNLKEKVN